MHLHTLTTSLLYAQFQVTRTVGDGQQWVSSSTNLSTAWATSASYTFKVPNGKRPAGHTGDTVGIVVGVIVGVVVVAAAAMFVARRRGQGGATPPANGLDVPLMEVSK